METQKSQSIEPKHNIVVSLPMRDGNEEAELFPHGAHDVVSLPMRDGNYPRMMRSGVQVRVVSLPMRDGDTSSEVRTWTA